MADSVDRVFGHALNTVNKIRPGATKPPPEDRLALYGLYKQAMEGDVRHLADRPTPSSSSSSSSPPDNAKEIEKYDAWKRNEGLSRTEAKRRYIETLIETMHVYASGTSEARQLVEELEFVWEQVRGNSLPSSGEDVGSNPFSESGSPLRGRRGGGETTSGELTGRSVDAALAGSDSGLLRVMSPVSQAEEGDLDDGELLEEEEEEGELEDGEEFVDAPVSQVDGDEVQADLLGEEEEEDRRRREIGRPRRGTQKTDARWRKRVESALIKLTAEVAALREQLESRRFWGHRQRYSLWGWMLRLSWWAVQLFVADAVILWFVILYMRRKKDNRLELAVRVLLGDAVATVQKVGSQVGHQIPRMANIRPGQKKSG